MLVSPKSNCPHISLIDLYPIDQFKKLPFEKLKCKYCDIDIELWICLTCSQAFCGRYMNNHYQKHLSENPEHIICISSLDLSVWCYKCETVGFSDLGSYIQNIVTNKYVKVLSDLKFGIDYSMSKNNINFKNNISKEQIFQIKYGNFIEMLKNKKFVNGVFMVGSGISVNSGIPNFRSKNGFFQKIIDKYHFDKPENFFSKETFIQKPNLLYEFYKDFKIDSYKPTLTHFFMKYLIDLNIVKKIYTLNIDGLELKSGIDKEKINFIQGNLLEGNCINCNSKIDIKEINNAIEKNEIKYCEKCKGLCKPNIILNEEKNEQNYEKDIKEIENYDICFIIGTSLKDIPFSFLPLLFKQTTWIVLINKKEVGSFDFGNIMNKNIFFEGDCDENVKKILKDCNWWDDFSTKYLN